MPKNLSGEFFIDTQNVKLYTQDLNDKFTNEQLCKEDNQYFICLTGCVLNLSQLIESTNSKDSFEMIKKLFTQQKEKIVQSLKGSYTLFIFDKLDKSVFLSNDLLSKKPLYYYQSDKLFAFANSFAELVNILKKQSITVTKDALAIAMMLQEGFVWEDVTWANEIKYLEAFDYIIIKDKNLSKQSFEYGFADSVISYNDALQEFDRLFTKAVKLQFAKAQKEGKKQLASLSAGMDSRATVLLAHKLGYKDIDTFTYAQTNSVDQTVSQKIAKDYDFKNTFYPLDNAEFMLQVEPHFARCEGEQGYCNGTGAYTTSHIFSNDGYAIIHTGLLGGEIMGDLQGSKTKTKVADCLPPNNIGAIFGEQKIKERCVSLAQKYSCSQQQKLQKHLRACQNFVKMSSDRFESFSPFMEEEVYTFLYSLPTEYKYERKFYIDWMNKYLPNDYITTYSFGKMYSNGLFRKAKYLLRIIKGKIFGKSKYDMNPFDYWKSTIKNLNQDMIEILKTSLDEIKDDFTKEQLQFLLSQTGSLSLIANSITVAKSIKMLQGGYPQNEKSICIYENTF